MDTYFETLLKPGWAPASWVYGTMRSVLHPIIAVAYGYVVVRVARGDFPTSLLVPIAINVAANVAFTPLLFGLRSLVLAEIGILVMLATIVWSIMAIRPHARLAALALTPYLISVGIATALQTGITVMNR